MTRIYNFRPSNGFEIETSVYAPRGITDTQTPALDKYDVATDQNYNGTASWPPMIDHALQHTSAFISGGAAASGMKYEGGFTSGHYHGNLWGQNEYEIQNSSTEVRLRWWTDINQPGFVGSLTGNYTVQFGNVIIANSDISVQFKLHRINNTGTSQTASSWTTAQTISATGDYTFTFTNLDLGTWSATDRLMLECQMTSASQHGSNAYIDVNWGTKNYINLQNNTEYNNTYSPAYIDASGYISTPFPIKQFIST